MPKSQCLRDYNYNIMHQRQNYTLNGYIKSCISPRVPSSKWIWHHDNVNVIWCKIILQLYFEIHSVQAKLLEHGTDWYMCLRDNGLSIDNQGISYFTFFNLSTKLWPWLYENKAGDSCTVCYMCICMDVHV